MQPYPHRYTVEATAGSEGRIQLRSAGHPPLESSAPVEFGGPGDRWSPETLFVAAVADCFVATFRSIAKASTLPWTSITCSGEGVLDRVDRVTRFTEIRLQVQLQLAAGGDRDRARRLLEKSEENCLVARSLIAPVHLEATVSAGDATISPDR